MATKSATIRVEHMDTHVEVVLARPHRHNALNAAMRDELVCALRALLADPEKPAVVLFADGPSFCSGGDLAEFGKTSPGAAGHLVRLGRHLPSLFADISDRLTVGIHGLCIGAGFELASFAQRVVATEDSRFSLPEVQMGLIPGSGGTVSVPGRIGRHRALWLMLTGCELDATSAFEWGAVDEVVPSTELRARVRAEQSS